MFIVTNRDVDERRQDLRAFGSRLNAKGPNELRMAEATRAGGVPGKGAWKIRILPDHLDRDRADEVGLPRIDPATGKAPFASRYVMKKLAARVNPAGEGLRGRRGRNLVFFVHGYNNDVKAVLDRAERFELLYGVEVIAFTWPANGGGTHGVVSYRSDKRDAQASTGALDRCLARFHEYLHEIHAEHVARTEALADARHPDDAEQWDRFFTEHSEKWCPFTANLVLHSMGNYVLKHVLMSSVYRGNLLTFDNIILAAADTNNEGHATWVDRLQCRRRVFITINENDSALRASRMKAGEAQKARLGHWRYNLDSTRACYIDFTRAQAVGSSHACFEGSPVTKNTAVRRFFKAAMNGEHAEEALKRDAVTGMYVVGGKSG